jgi:hypothetical protein
MNARPLSWVMDSQLITHLLRIVVLAPLYAVYGVFVVVRALVRAMGWINHVSAGLEADVHCMHGHPNPTVGRWVCGSCRATYDGWVGRCPICGSGASYIACRTCGVSVPLPWERG